MNVQTPKGYDFRLLIKAVVKKKKKEQEKTTLVYLKHRQDKIYMQRHSLQYYSL